jgi:hypothetical protein
MLRYTIIGFAAAALVSTTLIPDDALARGGGGFHGGGFRGGARLGAGYRPIQGRPIVPSAAARGAAVGAAVGAGAIRALVIGEAVGAPRFGRYYGNSYGRTALAAGVAKNARVLGSVERRGAAVGTAVGAGVATGAPAASVNYGGSGGYHNYCYRNSHGSLVCPSQSPAASDQGP